MYRREEYNRGPQTLDPAEMIKFPEGTCFIRPLTEKDMPVIALVVRDQEIPEEEIQKIRFGIFDEDYFLTGLFEDCTSAMEDAEENQYHLLWIH